MLTPRTRSHILIWLACFIILSACAAPAAPTPTPAPSPTVAPTLSPTVAPSPTLAATVAPSATPMPKALQLWASLPPERAAALADLLNELAPDTPVDVLPHPGELAIDVRAARLANQPLPDALWGNQDDLAALVQETLIQPINAPTDAAALLPAVLPGAQSNGKTYGIPVAADNFLLLLRNTRVTTATVTTSDDLIRLAREANQVQNQFGIVGAWGEPRWLLAWLTAYGGQLTDASGKPTLDTPQMEGAINLWKELRANGPPSPSPYTQSVRVFSRGASAFAIDGPWSLAGYRTMSTTLDLAIEPLPVVPATGQPAVAPLDGIYLMAVNAAQNDAVRTLGTALSTPEAQARLAVALGVLPANRAALTNPTLQADPVLAIAARTAERAQPVPTSREFRCAWRAIEEQLPPVLRGQTPTKDGITKMQEQADACVE